MRHILRLQDQDHGASLTGPPDSRRLLLDRAVLHASLTGGDDGAVIVQIDGKATRVYIAGGDDRFFIWLGGEVYEVAVLEPLALHARGAGAATGLETRAPMPGSVVALPVGVGDAVNAGDTLVIIESMKLELALKAAQPGRVATIDCAIGRSFAKDAVLITLSAEGAEHAAPHR